MPTKRAVYEMTSFKAITDSAQGKFEAIVSVFGNVDRVGDRVVKGAFAKSLGSWRTAGDPIPIIWSHDWADPHAHIGSADPKSVVETPQGLKVTGTIDLDNPFAAQVFRLMKERRVKEMSFAYDIVKERSADDGANELTQLDLIEVGPTLKGINPDTELLAVKAELETAAKAGRRISAATEAEMQAIHDDIESMRDGMDALMRRMRSMMGRATADDEDKALSEAEEPAVKATAEEEHTEPDEEPAVKSDDVLLAIKSRLDAETQGAQILREISYG